MIAGNLKWGTLPQAKLYRWRDLRDRLLPLEWGNLLGQILVPESPSMVAALPRMMRETVTVYIDVPAYGSTERRWIRKVLRNCNVQGETVERNNGTIRRISNAKTVYCSTPGYVFPDDYYLASPEEMEAYFTVGVGDLIIFCEVTDEVTSAEEFAALQKKYRSCMMKAGNVRPYFKGMRLDNLEISEE